MQENTERPPTHVREEASNSSGQSLLRQCVSCPGVGGATKGDRFGASHLTEWGYQAER